MERSSHDNEDDLRHRDNREQGYDRNIDDSFIKTQMIDLGDSTNKLQPKPKLESKIADRIKRFFLKKKSTNFDHVPIQRYQSKNLTFEDDEAFKELDELYQTNKKEKMRKRAKKRDKINSSNISEEKVDPNFERKLRNLNIQRLKNEENCYLKIVEMGSFEYLRHYTDRYPLLKIRKAIMYLYYVVQSFCYKIVMNPYFEYISMLLIITNTVFLMADDPTTISATSLADQTDTLFTILYTIEVLLKILAHGFIIGKKPFIKDAWNILDLLIIISSWITFFLTNININLTALRSLRVIRPLKTISKIKKLRMLITTILSAVPLLLDIFFILLFVFFVFAIAGLNLFNGALQNRCVDVATGELNPDKEFCTEGSSCPNGYTCKDGFENPDWGVTHFDNIGNSMLMIFQITTLEGWYDIMEYLTTAFSGFFIPIIYAYFVFLIFIGTFFILNLTLAVIKVKFEESREMKEEIQVDIKHKKNCICDEGVVYNKMKICGYFESIWKVSKRNSGIIHTLKDMHHSTRIKKKSGANHGNKSSKITQIAKSLADIDAKKQSFSDKEDSVLLQKMDSKGSKTEKDIPSIISSDEDIIEVKDKRQDSYDNISEDNNKHLPDVPPKRSNVKNYTTIRNKPKLERNKSESNILYMKKRDNNIEMNGDMMNMIDVYNRILENNSKIKNKFEQINIQTDVKNDDISSDNSSNKSSIRSKSWEKSDVNEEHFKQDLMKTIMYDGDKHEHSDDNDWDKRIQNFRGGKSTIINTQKSKFMSAFNRQTDYSDVYSNTNKTIQRRNLLSKDEIKVKNFLERKIKYVKLVLNECKSYNPIEFFDSRDDIFPSKEIRAEAQIAQEKLQQSENTQLDFEYNKTHIVHELQNKLQRKGAKAPLKISKLNSNANKTYIPTMSSIVSLETSNVSSKNAVGKLFGNHDDFNLNLDYYPLAEPMHKVISNNNVVNISKSNNTKSYRKSSKNNKNSEENKLLKETAKNFQSVKEYFQEEFKPLPDRNELYDTEKKALDHYYNSIIDQDLRSNKIDRHNWSGFEIMPFKNFDIMTFEGTIDSLNNGITEMWLPGFMGKITVIRRYVRQFITKDIVENFFNLVVFLNTLVLSLEGLLPSSWTPIISDINVAFTIIFTVELVLKIVGLGPRRYIKDYFNIFDAVIVGFSLFELGMGRGSSLISAARAIRAFRAIRVLRVARLLRTLRFMKVIMEVVTNAVEQFAYIALLLTLFIIVFSLIGMQLFAGRFDFFEENAVRFSDFDNFGNSFIVTFELLTTEDWQDVLYLCMRSSQNPFISVAYLVIWIFIGNYIFLNLFLAILLDGFSSYASLNKFKEIEDEDKRLQKIFKEHKEIMESRKAKKEDKHRLFKMMEEEEFEEIQDRFNSINKQNTTYDSRKNLKELRNEYKEKENSNLNKSRNDNNSIINSVDSDNDIENYLRSKKSSKKKDDLYANIIEEDSLFMFKKNNCVRVAIANFVLNPLFEKLIIFFIILSSIKLVVETYHTESWDGTAWQKFLDILDIVLNVLFILESMFKIITYGFIFSEGSYLRDSASLLDFFIVITSTLDMLFSDMNFGFFRILRLLRTLRPLRFLTHYENLRVAVSCLVESITGIVNVFIVVFLVFIIFSILGIHLLKGKMGYCDKSDLASYYGINKADCLAMGGSWARWGWNFDNIIHGLITLYLLSSIEGWPEMMYTMMDSDIEERGPSHRANYYIFIFVIMIILVCALFFMNLFVSVIIVQFATEHDKERKKRYRFVTDDQMKWILMQKLVVNATPEIQLLTPPKNKIRAIFFKISQSKFFDLFIMSCILLNMITMGIIYTGMSQAYSDVLDNINLTFTFIFILEAVIKIIGYGFMNYIREGWNQFDFVIAIVSVLDVLISVFFNLRSLRIYPQLLRVIRILRITRLFKLTKNKSFENLNKIIKTLVFAFPALFNILALLLLIYFIYAILGVYIYRDEPGLFDNFGLTFLELFRFSTGEEFQEEIFIYSENKPVVGRLYFISFIFLTYFVMLNMFASVVIEQFENFYFNPDNPVTSFREIADEFRKTWSYFTIEQRGLKIKSSDLFNFFICLKSPLGFYVPSSDQENSSGNHKDFNINFYLDKLKHNHNFIRQQIAKMNLYIDEKGYVSFGQVLHAAMKNVFGNKIYNNGNKSHEIVKEIEKKTMAIILKKNMNLSKLGSSRRKKLKLKVANPFINLLFLKLTYNSWYNHTKRQISKQNKEKHDTDNDSDSDSDFEHKVLSKIKKPDILNK